MLKSGGNGFQALNPHKKDIVMHELSRVEYILSAQSFDLNEEEFEDFINNHAPHLFEVAYQNTINAMNQLSFESQANDYLCCNWCRI